MWSVWGGGCGYRSIISKLNVYSMEQQSLAMDEHCAMSLIYSSYCLPPSPLPPPHTHTYMHAYHYTLAHTDAHATHTHSCTMHSQTQNSVVSCAKYRCLHVTRYVCSSWFMSPLVAACRASYSSLHSRLSNNAYLWCSLLQNYSLAPICTLHPRLLHVPSSSVAHLFSQHLALNI